MDAPGSAATDQAHIGNISAAILPSADAQRKALATLQAVGALGGLRVERVLGRNGRSVYVVIRGGRAIDCSDLDAVRSAMVRMGVQ